jgi:hypothetical protein
MVRPIASAPIRGDIETIEKRATNATRRQWLIAVLLLGAYAGSNLIIGELRRGVTSHDAVHDVAYDLGRVAGSALLPFVVVVIAMCWRTNRTEWKAVRIFSLATFSLLLLNATSAAAIFGVHGYLVRKKSADGQAGLAALADGVARCAATTLPDGTPRGLPGTSAQAPVRLAAARGQAYASTPADWAETAFQCAGFTRTGPERFTYQWRKKSAMSGVVIASADSDDDGVVDITMERAVNCPDGVHCVVHDVVYH